MSAIAKQIRLRSKEFPETKPLDYHRYLVISLGTGLPEQDIKFDALHVAKWGFFEWLGRHFTMPLLHMFLHASSDMTDSHVANLFKSIGCSDQLLRIQVDIPCVYKPMSTLPVLVLQMHAEIYIHLLFCSTTTYQ